MVTLETLSTLAEWMQAKGVLRLRTPDGLELELHPSTRPAPAASSTVASSADPVVPVALAFSDNDGSGVCACGHSWAIEHDPKAGCLLGCSWELCTSNVTDEPEGAL